MAARSGKCVNFGLCNKADSREVISASEDFMCPECGKPLSSAGSGGGKGPGAKLLVPLVVLAALLGGGSYWLLSDHSSTSQSQTQSDQDQTQTAIVEPPPVPLDDNQQQIQNPTDTDSPIGDRDRPRRQIERPRQTVRTPRQPPGPGPSPREDRSDYRDKPADDKPAYREVEAPPTPAKNLDLEGTTTLNAKLMSPISTRLNREGDKFTAEVEDGPYKGSILSGTITKLEKKKKNSELTFAFETISSGGLTKPIKAEVKSVENTKGVKGVDEEGNVIGESSKKKQGIVSGIGAGIGGLIGGLKGGAKGALIGAGVGGAAGFAASMTVVSRAAEVDFAPGSLFTLDVSPRQR